MPGDRTAVSLLLTLVSLRHHREHKAGAGGGGLVRGLALLPYTPALSTMPSNLLCSINISWVHKGNLKMGSGSEKKETLLASGVCKG